MRFRKKKARVPTSFFWRRIKSLLNRCFWNSFIYLYIYFFSIYLLKCVYFQTALKIFFKFDYLVVLGVFCKGIFGYSVLSRKILFGYKFSFKIGEKMNARNFYFGELYNQRICFYFLGTFSNLILVLS